MQELIDKLKEILNMPYIRPYVDVVVDGSFALSVDRTSGLRGNGVQVDQYVNYTLNIFCKSEEDAVLNAIVAKENLEALHCYCSDPAFTYEREATMFRAEINIQKK